MTTRVGSRRAAAIDPSEASHATRLLTRAEASGTYDAGDHMWSVMWITIDERPSGLTSNRESSLSCRVTCCAAIAIDEAPLAKPLMLPIAEEMSLTIQSCSVGKNAPGFG